MKYSEFEDIISQQRMRKYLLACNNESKRAMTLYRYNLKLSQEMFALISCFEVTLRNRIDKEMKAHFGNDWLRDFILPGGQFHYDPRVEGNNVQYRLGGRCLLHIFPNKPRSTRTNRIDNSRIFLELDYINNIRNRIAHHEPICFGYPICIDTTYTLNNYTRMMTLFQWMGIDANDFLYGIDHVGRECGKIMCI